MKRTQRLTHPADGLYYLSAALLRRHRACNPHADYWIMVNGAGEVPVTLANLTYHMQHVRTHSSGGHWLLLTMARKGLISERERIDAGWPQGELSIFHVSKRAEARIVMDCLETRARREGRLS